MNKNKSLQFSKLYNIENYINNPAFEASLIKFVNEYYDDIKELDGVDFEEILEDYTTYMHYEIMDNSDTI